MSLFIFAEARFITLKPDRSSLNQSLLINMKNYIKDFFLMTTIKDTSFTRYENSYFTFYKENCLSFSNLDIVVFSKYTNCPGCWTQ